MHYEYTNTSIAKYSQQPRRNGRLRYKRVLCQAEQKLSHSIFVSEISLTKEQFIRLHIYKEELCWGLPSWHEC